MENYKYARFRLFSTFLDVILRLSTRAICIYGWNDSVGAAATVN